MHGDKLDAVLHAYEQTLIQIRKSYILAISLSTNALLHTCKSCIRHKHILGTISAKSLQSIAINTNIFMWARIHLLKSVCKQEQLQGICHKVKVHRDCIPAQVFQMPAMFPLWVFLTSHWLARGLIAPTLDCYRDQFSSIITLIPSVIIGQQHAYRQQLRCVSSCLIENTSVWPHNPHQHVHKNCCSRAAYEDLQFM